MSLAMSLRTVILGSAYGYGLALDKDLEDGCIKNGSQFYKAIWLAYSGLGALEIISLALRETKVITQLPPSTGLFCAFGILGISYLDNRLDEKDQSTKGVAVKKINAHLGSAFQIAALISSIAIAYFGQPLFGLCMATWLALGFVTRKEDFSVKGRKIIDLTGFLVLEIQSIISYNALSFVYLIMLYKLKGLPLSLGAQ